LSAGGVDQQRLGGAADGDAPHLRVEHDGARHVGVRGGVQEGVAEPLQVSEHRRPRLRPDALQQAASAAGHDQVDGAAETRQQGAHGRAVGGGHDLDGRGIEPGLRQPFDEGGVDRRALCSASEPPRRITACPSGRPARRRRR
jgi:hypothetical protein